MSERIYHPSDVTVVKDSDGAVIGYRVADHANAQDWHSPAAMEEDLCVLAFVGRMYLNALDDDPEHEMLTLPEALRVTAVREAVDRWELR